VCVALIVVVSLLHAIPLAEASVAYLLGKGKLNSESGLIQTGGIINEQHIALARKNRELQALAEENRVRLLQEQSARAELEAILTTMTDGVRDQQAHG
jgi:hypothetical protein